MNDLQRVRAWLLEQKEKRMLNALAESIKVDRRTMQRIINQPDYHPRFDTLQVLLDAMNKDGRKRGKAVKPSNAEIESVAGVDRHVPVGGPPIDVASTESSPHGTITIHYTKED